jgi:DNA-directed RNA polymerase alpha subunit
MDSRPITDLSFSSMQNATRVLNSLRSAGIHTIEQLERTCEEELFLIRSFGEISLIETKRALARLGTRLRDTSPAEPEQERSSVTLRLQPGQREASLKILIEVKILIEEEKEE